ncbi:MAG: hypothetical protein IPK26_22830 [Planctomycetes bacterium]|nr:hypothetical protein [Planctomycetota bacterium]
MRVTPIVAISFLLSGALALAIRLWPCHERRGWFELDGQLRALDGAPVRDWSHANDLLARYAAEGASELADQSAAAHQAGNSPPGPLLREFTVDYVPADGDGRVVRMRVGQRLPEHAPMIGRHPIAGATYQLIGADPKGQQR